MKKIILISTLAASVIATSAFAAPASTHHITPSIGGDSKGISIPTAIVKGTPIYKILSGISSLPPVKLNTITQAASNAREAVCYAQPASDGNTIYLCPKNDKAYKLKTLQKLVENNGCAVDTTTDSDGNEVNTISCTDPVCASGSYDGSNKKKAKKKRNS